MAEDLRRGLLAARAEGQLEVIPPRFGCCRRRMLPKEFRGGRLDGFKDVSWPGPAEYPEFPDFLPSGQDDEYQVREDSRGNEGYSPQGC